jgi:hypothetical protein
VFTAKQAKVRKDPELCAAYGRMAREHSSIMAGPGIETEHDAVCTLLLTGLEAR